MDEILTNSVLGFLFFYWINLLLDYPLQCEFQKKYKQEYHTVMMIHCMIWGFGLSFALVWFGKFAWWKLFMLVLGHFIVDTWKARRWYEGRGTDGISAGGFGWFRGSSRGLSDGTAYIIDQSLHIVQMVVAFFS